MSQYTSIRFERDPVPSRRSAPFEAHLIEHAVVA